MVKLSTVIHKLDYDGAELAGTLGSATTVYVNSPMTIATVGKFSALVGVL